MIDVLTLHVGHIKTGTSSVQLTFRDSADVLAAHGLHYYAAHRSQHPLARAFDPRNGRPGDRRHVIAFRREAVAREWPQSLVSSELLAEADEETASALLAEMRRVARRVRVLLYVRHPVALANSAAAQGVRSGRTLEDIIARPRVLPLRRIVEHWWRRVGEDAVVVRPFDRAHLVRGDVVDDILAVLGIAEAAPGLTRRQANEGLSVLGVHLLERAQRRAPGGRMRQQMMRPFGEIGGPRYVLPRAALEDVRRRGEPELAFLREAFGITLAEPDLEPTAPPGLSEAELDSLARVLGEAAQYMDASARTRAARILGVTSPYTAPPWDVEPHRLAPLMRRLGLSRRLTRAPAGVRGEAEPR